MSDDVLRLFEGLTREQMKEFRRRVVPVLQELRREIVSADGGMETTSNLPTRVVTNAAKSRNNQAQNNQR